MKNEIREEFVDYFKLRPADKPVDLFALARHFVEWQKKRDQETIELAEEHGMLAGRVMMEKEMLEKAVEAKVIKSYNPCSESPDITYHAIELVYKDTNAGISNIVAGHKVKIIILPTDEKHS